MTDSPVAIVTGGAQGIGAAISIELLTADYKVVVADIKEEIGQNFVREQRKKYGAEKVEFVVCDVTKEKDFRDTFEFTMKNFKRIDLVVNNAGIILESNPRKVIEVNLIGPIIGCQLALEYMGKSRRGNGGVVINTASVAGFVPFYAAPVYAASKHAVIGLTRSYGTPYHLEKDNVLFAAICPFYATTDVLNDCSTNTLDPSFHPVVTNKSDIMSPEYVARGVLKLLEDRINGATLVIRSNKGYEYVGIQKELVDTII